MPAWLKSFFNWLGEALAPVGRFLRWLGDFLPDAPYARVLLWLVVALGAAALAWAIYNRRRYGEWRLRFLGLKSVDAAEIEPVWAPDSQVARSWLQEADALAGAGRFAEAIHHLLFRSVEDIGRRRPGLARPALTSRELASSEAIPGQARGLFAAIAAKVEQSLFGGRPVGECEWLEARQAYSEFALPTAWRA
jgi:hypothetical protein